MNKASLVRAFSPVGRGDRGRLPDIAGDCSSTHRITETSNWGLAGPGSQHHIHLGAKQLESSVLV